MMSEKHVTAIKPTLDFRALFGVGIDTGRDAPVELVPAEEATNFWWRRGRVELPVQKKLPRIYYKLFQLFNLTWLTSADRV